MDALNHLLAKYIGLATNSPKNFPRSPLLTPKVQIPGAMTPEQMEKMAQQISNKFNKKDG